MKGIKHTEIRASLLSTQESKLAYEEAHHEAELTLMLQAIGEKAGITRIEVAKRMGVTAPMVTRLEKNAAKASIHTLERYATACGARLNIHAESLSTTP